MHYGLDEEFFVCLLRFVVRQTNFYNLIPLTGITVLLNKKAGVIWSWLHFKR
jgi:hypothetical protein